MRHIFRVTVLIVMTSLSSAVAQRAALYVTVTDESPAFSRPDLKGKVSFNLVPGDMARVIETKPKAYKVTDNRGRIGWVAKSGVKMVKTDRSFSFENAFVNGFFENPQPAFILDSDDPLGQVIYLNRSFKDELRQHTDKETAQRIDGHYPHSSELF